MTRTTNLRWALPAVMLALGLAACDGDDGAMGAQGPQGPQGPTRRVLEVRRQSRLGLPEWSRRGR